MALQCLRIGIILIVDFSKMSESGNSGSAGPEVGNRIILAFLSQHIEEVRAVDGETFDLMSRLLSVLCQKVNEEAAALQAETAESREDGQQLQKELDILSIKLHEAESENTELREELQELVAEMAQRQGEYENELENCKGEVERSRGVMLESAGHQERLEQLFREYEIKIGEVEQQKLFLRKNLGREESRRASLEEKLQQVQGQLVQLSHQFQSLELSHEKLSHSLESKEDCIRQLNRIIEESEYLSSLSPHSHQRINDLPEQDNSYTSQQLARTLGEEQLPLLRLSQSQLPAEQSIELTSAVSIEEQPEVQLLAVPKSERAMVASERKLNKKHQKVVLSHQKKPSKEELSLRKDPEKSKTIKQDTKTIALSKQDSRAVKSKLTSIFRDRLKYKSEHDQLHEERLNQLNMRLQEREEEIKSLSRQVSLLRVVRAEPVVVSSGSKEGRREVHHLRTENEALRRITREIALRKEYLESELEEFRERCAYYKAEYRKVYEQYLLKNAESIAYSEQLSEFEMSQFKGQDQRGEKEQGEGEMMLEKGDGEGEEMLLEVQQAPLDEHRDEFEDLSSKFNNLVLKHSHAAFNNELQEPSFKSAESYDHKDFYTIQNIHFTDNSLTERTLEHERKIPFKNEPGENSPAKAVLNEDAPMEDLILEGIQAIALRETYNPNQGEIQTERLILSQMMQTSRRQNSLTEFQLFFSDRPPKLLMLVSLGCLAEHRVKEKKMAIIRTETIFLAPQQHRFTVYYCEAFTFLPKDKCSVAVGDNIQSHNQHIQTESISLANSFCQVIPEKQDFEQIFAPIQEEGSTNTEKTVFEQAYTNTYLIGSNSIGVESNRLEVQDQFMNTQTCEIASLSTNTEKISYEQLSVQTNVLLTRDVSQGTDHIILVDQQVSTNLLRSQNVGTQTSNKKLCQFRFNIAHQMPRNSKLSLAGPLNVVQLKKVLLKTDQATNFDIPFLSDQQTNTDIKHSRDVSINYHSKQLQLCSSVPSLTIRPTIHLLNLSLVSQAVHHKISKGSTRLQLDLSFLQSHQSESDEKAHCEGEQQMISLKPSIRSRNFTLGPQISSCRTRSSSQDIHSNRSNQPEKPWENPRKKEMMRESMISQQSEGSDRTNKNEQTCKGISDLTASHTPFLDKTENSLAVSRIVEEHHVQKGLQKEELEVEQDVSGRRTVELNAYSDNELNVIKDYFYRLKRFEICQTLEVSQKRSLTNYDFQRNMYLFHAKKGEKTEKFACWNGRIIHFGNRVETMELISPSNACRKFKGSVALGNSEFRILENKLQINRANKQRCFKGEMENGEWVVERVWVFKAN